MYVWTVYLLHTVKHNSATMSQIPQIHHPVDKGMWKPDVGLLMDAGNASEPQAKQEITAHATVHPSH